MKPCRKYRPALVILALQQECEAELRAHLADCDDCREYLNEISDVAASLKRTSEGEDGAIKATERFHQRVMRSISDAAPVDTGLSFLRPAWLRLGFAGAVLAAIAITVHLGTRQNPTVGPIAQNHATTPAPAPDLPAPTASEYLAVANRSLDQFDDLVTRQARQNLTPAPSVKLVSLLRGD